MWVLYVDYSSSADGTHLQCGMHIYSGAYANNVKCMYITVPAHIVDCNRFIGGIYTDTEVLYVDIN